MVVTVDGSVVGSGVVVCSVVVGCVVGGLLVVVV